MSLAKLARERSTLNLTNNLLPQIEFMEPLSESILCLICGKVLRDPQQLSCGHRVCKGCNEHALSNNKDGVPVCPDDGEEIARVFPDRSALIDIMNLACFCLAKDEGCKWSGLLLDLEQHVTSCDFFSETPCPYKDFHCTFVGSRQRLTKHLENDENMAHHCLLAFSIQQCAEDLRKNSERMSNIKESSERMGDTMGKTRKESEALQHDLCAKIITMNQLENKESENLKQRAGTLEELVNELDKKKLFYTSFHDKFKSLVKNCKTQMTYFDSEVVSRTESEPKVSLTDKVKRLDEFNASHGKQINDLGVKIRIAQCSNNTGDYTWKLDNFRSRFNEALKGKVRELYTPPLYTSQFGYKYSAKVMLAGEKGKVTCNYLGFYLLLMQGDYDEILKFPFPYPIEITLINFSNNPNVSHTLYPDPKKAHFEKPYKNMNPAIGFARFVSHEKLKNDGFIKNDTIYFKINVKRNNINVNEPDI